MYTIQEAAKLLGVSISTMRRWEKEGKIKPIRTQGGHRRYTLEELSQIKPLQHDTKLTIAYCRVSSSDQKEDLQRQVENVSQYCTAKGYSFKVITDIGSGLNYNKKGLKELLHLVQSNKLERIVVNYKDRLIRFGYEIIEQICEFHGVTIEIINHTEDKTYEQELVEDILSIITVFSSRLYGSRSHKQKKIQKEAEKWFKESDAI